MKYDLIIVLVFLSIFSLVYCVESKAECSGSVAFVGYGNGWASVSDKTQYKGQSIKQSRSIHLAVVGIEHNFNWLRIQIYHQSNLENGLVRSFDDVWAANILYKYDF